MVEKVIINQFKMDSTQKASLESMTESIMNAKKAIEGLEAAGMNVDVLKTELKTAEQRRDALLKYFG